VAALDPHQDFLGRGTRRSLVEGFFPTPKSPSTALRAVPLPGKCRGGILTASRFW
jgi:hypothetical protein